jgi:hypothetical protein
MAIEVLRREIRTSTSSMYEHIVVCYIMCLCVYHSKLCVYLCACRHIVYMLCVL